MVKDTHVRVSYSRTSALSCKKLVMHNYRGNFFTDQLYMTIVSRYGLKMLLKC
jgi:hypothetical protein